MMKKIKIFLILLVLFISISAVSAEGNFTTLQDEIHTSTERIEINQNYIYDNSTDYKLNSGILVNKSDFTINGNGHTIDASNQARIFNINGNNITINNLIFINGYNNDTGGAIFSNATITLNNVIFTNNRAENGGAIFTENTITINNATFNNNQANSYGGAINTMGKTTINNTTFNNNKASNGGAIIISNETTINNIILNNNQANAPGGSIYVENSALNLKNGNFKSENTSQSLIYLTNSLISIENTTFANTTSDYAPAIYFSNSSGKIRNCNFVNLNALISGGAIGIEALANEMTIENCNFINTKSQKNGGAVYADVAGGTHSSEKNAKSIKVINTTFVNCNSGFGGAILQLNGNLNIEKSKFNSNNASVSGGAIYTSYTDLNLKNSEFINNFAFKNGGANYMELTNSTIDNVLFIANKVENNSMLNPSTIYAYDSSSYIKNSFFNNSKYSISSVFTIDYLDENNTVNDDEFNWDNKIYLNGVVDEGIKIKLINNSIDVTSIPSKFDLREWGWVSPVKNQLSKGYCWVFGTIASLESALLKSTGMEYDFSENNIGNNGIIYSKYGNTENTEGGIPTTALGAILSWSNLVPEDCDTYDDIGKVSDIIGSINTIHVQDALLIPVKKTADHVNTNETNNLIKQAMLKYGSVQVCYFGEGLTIDDVHIYHNNTYENNHAVCLVGWDDNYSKDKFPIKPPGDGAWILKNSWGNNTGINGYQYISYYDTSLLAPDSDGFNETPYGIAFIIENTENYKYNYQTDLIGLRGTDENYTYYSNEYMALANNLLGAVGTYFNDSGIDYELKIYVNDELKITQNGTSDFSGFKTIKLNEYVPVKENDVFKVVFKNNMLPYQSKSRQHYLENTSFASADGINWIDCAMSNMTACLKVYAFDLPIYTENLVKIYKNSSQFEVNIGIGNKTVSFEINGRKYNRTSDENGTARLAINLNPGNYTIKTTFNGTTVENTVTVLPTLIAEDLVKYCGNASQFFISLINGEGNAVTGKNITLNINGVFYNRLTNENGTAKLNINLEPGEYILTATDPLTGLQMSYNITVLPVLFADNLEMKYKDGSTFNTLVLNGEGKPLTNAKVTFNVNGVFYTKYSNSSGIAKLNINLMAGEYIITSEYDGMRISNTITIKD